MRTVTGLGGRQWNADDRLDAASGDYRCGQIERSKRAPSICATQWLPVVLVALEPGGGGAVWCSVPPWSSRLATTPPPLLHHALPLFTTPLRVTDCQLCSLATLTLPDPQKCQATGAGVDPCPNSPFDSMNGQHHLSLILPIDGSHPKIFNPPPHPSPQSQTHAALH